MFKKMSRMAEQAATGLSRRDFLGRVGLGAMTLAAALGGLLALPAASRGEKPVPGLCNEDSDPGCVHVNEGSSCGTKKVCKGDPQDKSDNPVCHCVNGPATAARRGPRR